MASTENNVKVYKIKVLIKAPLPNQTLTRDKEFTIEVEVTDNDLIKTPRVADRTGSDVSTANQNN